jgi:hypothetical protein
MAVKDEFNHRPQVIIDHTWFGINEHTIAELPKEVMQFGGALPRLLWILRHADQARGRIYLSKFDIDNGFYRLFLDANDALKLAALLPRYKGEEQLLAVPLVLTMGWGNSPPTFCAASETVADLANANLYKRTVPPHRLEHLASAHDVWEPLPPGGPQSPPNETSPDDAARAQDYRGPPSLGRPPSPTKSDTQLPPPRPQPENRPPILKLGQPVAHVDVFVDDYIGIAQGSQ